MPIASLPARLIRLALCPLPLFASWISIRMATAWHPTLAAQGVAYASACLSVGLLFLCLYALFVPSAQRIRRNTSRAFLIVSLVGFAPALSRALLPWEEPGTGSGSPLAVLIGLVFLAAAGFVFVTAPMLLVWLITRPARQQTSAPPPAGCHDSPTSAQ